jgi:hypothetical protein
MTTFAAGLFSRVPRWTALLPFLIGSLFMGSVFYYELRYVVAGVEGSGRILRFAAASRRSTIAVIYYDVPPASGEGAAGAVCRQTVLMRESFPLHEPLPIRYLPSDPSLCRIDTFWQLWSPLIGKIVVGSALPTLAMAVYRGGK